MYDWSEADSLHQGPLTATHHSSPHTPSLFNPSSLFLWHILSALYPNSYLQLRFNRWDLTVTRFNTSYIHCSVAAPSIPPPFFYIKLQIPPPPPFPITISASFLTRRLCPTHPTSAHFCLITPHALNGRTCSIHRQREERREGWREML